MPLRHCGTADQRPLPLREGSPIPHKGGMTKVIAPSSSIKQKTNAQWLKPWRLYIRGNGRTANALLLCHSFFNYNWSTVGRNYPTANGLEGRSLERQVSFWLRPRAEGRGPSRRDKKTNGSESSQSIRMTAWLCLFGMVMTNNIIISLTINITYIIYVLPIISRPKDGIIGLHILYVCY